MIRAVVSIGTNSTRALVADVNGSAHVLLARWAGTRIGEGLKERGRLDPAAAHRTLNAVRDHVEAIKKYTRNITAIATSALRRAEDAGAFARQVEAIAGSPLEIISGEEEARRSYTGAVGPLLARKEHSSRFSVLDVGGGSSEYACGREAQPDEVVSCEIGAVRLTERVPALAGTKGPVGEDAVERARALAREALEPIARFPRPETLVLVGGSSNTGISLLRESTERYEYAEMERGELRALISRLRTHDLAQRKAMPGMNPQRADILLAGLIVVDTVFELTGATNALATGNDLLLGTLLRCKQ